MRGLVEGLLDSMKVDGLWRLEVVEGVMEVVGEILGVADVDELEAWGFGLGSVTVDELKGPANIRLKDTHAAIPLQTIPKCSQNFRQTNALGSFHEGVR